MKKLGIVYWSGTGNTEAMADLIAQGARSAGAQAELIPVTEFSADRIEEFDALAWGCPAMGDEELEDTEFEPVWSECIPSLDATPIVLFGSYDWNDGEWMELWEKQCEDEGLVVLDSLIAKDYPDEEASAECLRIGALMAR